MKKLMVVLLLWSSPSIAQTVMPKFDDPIDKAKAAPVDKLQPWSCSIIDGAKVSFGQNYKPGVYQNTPLSGGSGTKAAADITVGANGKIENLAFKDPGNGYKPGDVLTASLPNGSGFSLTVEQVRDDHPAFKTRTGDVRQEIARTKKHPTFVGSSNPCPKLIVP